MGRSLIKNPAASGRGIEADLLPNPRFGLQALELRRRAAGNMSPTRFNPKSVADTWLNLARLKNLGSPVCNAFLSKFGQ